MRTPIQPILGLADVVSSKIKEDEQLSQLLDVINRNAKRLQRLTEDILDVTRIESNLLKLHKTIFDLNDTIKNIIADCEREEQRTKNCRKIGLSSSDHLDKRLFTKFVTNSSVGTGLGLYISKSIVEAHGGKMWAKNNRNGRGATFSFVLPMINFSPR